MKFHALFGAIACAAAIAGCKSGHSIVGKWSSTDQMLPMTTELTSDLKITSTMELPAPASMSVIATGAYKLQGEKLTINYTDLKFKAADATTQAKLDAKLATEKKTLLEKLNDAGASQQISWTSDDEFLATDKNGKQVLHTRIKP